jgi:hypothetical protein
MCLSRYLTNIQRGTFKLIAMSLQHCAFKDPRKYVAPSDSNLPLSQSTEITVA